MTCQLGNIMKAIRQASHSSSQASSASGPTRSAVCADGAVCAGGASPAETSDARTGDGDADAGAADSGATTAGAGCAPAAAVAFGRSGRQSVTFTAHRLYQPEAELGPESPDADVDDVRAGIEVDSPHRGQQLTLGHCSATTFHQGSQQQELKPGEGHGTATAVCYQPTSIENELADLHDFVRLPAGPQPGSDSRDQLGQREWLGQVIAGAEIKAFHFGFDVRGAGEHQDLLAGLEPQDRGQHRTAVQIGHDQVQDHQAVAAGGGPADAIGCITGDVYLVTDLLQRPADEAADARLVVDEQNPGRPGRRAGRADGQWRARAGRSVVLSCRGHRAPVIPLRLWRRRSGIWRTGPSCLRRVSRDRVYSLSNPQVNAKDSKHHIMFASLPRPAAAQSGPTTGAAAV